VYPSVDHVSVNIPQCTDMEYLKFTEWLQHLKVKKMIQNVYFVSHTILYSVQSSATKYLDGM